MRAKGVNYLVLARSGGGRGAVSDFSATAPTGKHKKDGDELIVSRG
jgi:hypothetical protein